MSEGMSRLPPRSVLHRQSGEVSTGDPHPSALEGTTAFRLFGNPLGAMLRKVLYDICRILSIKSANGVFKLFVKKSLLFYLIVTLSIGRRMPHPTAFVNG